MASNVLYILLAISAAATLTSLIVTIKYVNKARELNERTRQLHELSRISVKGNLPLDVSPSEPDPTRPPPPSVEDINESDQP